MKKRLVSLLLVLVLAFTLVPSAFADTSDCGISMCTCPRGGCTYAYTNYRPNDARTHLYSVYCTGCGIGGGVVLEDTHTFRNGKCIYCGYQDVCYHDYTYVDWDGCYWYEYCYDCGDLVDYGVSHGVTVYDDWEYYSSSQHRRYAYCRDCGDGSYQYASHSTTTKYSTYTSTQHRVNRYCATCDSNVGSTTYESHDFSYGSWQNYNGTQHRRTKTCRDCGYSSYDYANHSYSYGSWTNSSDTQHRRTKTCSTCGYSTYEYASHSFYLNFIGAFEVPAHIVTPMEAGEQRRQQEEQTAKEARSQELAKAREEKRKAEKRAFTARKRAGLLTPEEQEAEERRLAHNR